jgi:hypothetical protein
MVMVEYFANSPTCALGDFACALGGADSDVLASHGSAFADIASCVEWVKCDKVASTFPNTLGRRPSTLGGSFADVSGAPADVASWAALMGLLLGGRLRFVGRSRWGLGLAVLTGGVLAADGKCECKERDESFWECGSHELNPLLVGFDASVEDSLLKTEKLAKTKMLELQAGFANSGGMVAMCRQQSSVQYRRFSIQVKRTSRLPSIFDCDAQKKSSLERQSSVLCV